MSTSTFLCFSIFCLVASVECFNAKSVPTFVELGGSRFPSPMLTDTFPVESVRLETSAAVYIGPQDGLKLMDKIESLPGQPDGVNFNHYSGYVTVDSLAGRALFYYFVESPHNSQTKPLILWHSGGDSCSSFGAGALMEIGPFRVRKDGKTLYQNEYAWTQEANIIFLESPASVGFSYSNRTSDYKLNGDHTMAQDTYIFLVNWLGRFPEYKTRDFFIAGELYAGHSAPQLAQLILHNNMYNYKPMINLKGILIGNAAVDAETNFIGVYNYYWTHAIMSDEIYEGIVLNCKSTSSASFSHSCLQYLEKATSAIRYINNLDIYAPSCNSPSASSAAFDPCSTSYMQTYLNVPQVQQALHANITALPYPWVDCNINTTIAWKDRASTVLPIIRELMEKGTRVWMYSGDLNAIEPVTSTKYAIERLGVSVKTAWYPWYTQGEVGGYAVEYQDLTFATVRGSGASVASYQPARALALFSSFINGTLPPRK